MSNQDLGDLILEGVVNSVEAGASEIFVSLDECVDSVKVRIEDNGVLIKGDFFTPGFSSKGDGRGMGLQKILSRDREAMLYSENGRTILSFQTLKDNSLDKLEDMLFPVFQVGEQTTFSYLKEGKEVFSLTERGISLTRASKIAEFKDLVRSKIRSV